MPDFSLADILGAQAGAPGPVYEGGPTGNVTPGQVLSAIGGMGGQAIDKFAIQPAKNAITAADYYSKTGDVYPLVHEATQTGLGLAGVGLPFAEAGAAGIFGGRIGAERLAAAGKPEALNNLPKAEEMLAGGYPPHEIHAATGWAPDAAGKLSFEIPDYGTGFRPMAPLPEGTGVEGQLSPFIGGPIGKPGREMLAEHAYAHPDLYTAYPELARYAMKFEDPVKREGFLFKGGADPVNKDFYLNPEAFSGPGGREAMRSTMLHEFQHPVQAIEDFPSGGSPGMPEVRQAADQAIARRSEAINQKIQDLYAQRDAYVRSVQETAQDPGRDISTQMLAKEFWDANPEMVKEAARLHAQQAINEHGITRNSEVIKQYKGVAGEVQARNVQARADIPPEQLKDLPPSYTQDTPNSQQLLRFSDPATGYDLTRGPTKTKGLPSVTDEPARFSSPANTNQTIRQRWEAPPGPVSKDVQPDPYYAQRGITETGQPLPDRGNVLPFRGPLDTEPLSFTERMAALKDAAFQRAQKGMATGDYGLGTARRTAPEVPKGSFERLAAEQSQGFKDDTARAIDRYRAATGQQPKGRAEPLLAPGERPEDLYFSGEPKPTTEMTPIGEQYVLPGAEKASEGTMAQRLSDLALKPKVAQKPADVGLFGDEGKQGLLFSGEVRPRMADVLEGAMGDVAGPQMGVGSPYLRNPNAPLFDYARMGERVPTKQFGLTRTESTDVTPDFAKAGRASNIARVNKIVEQGIKEGGLDWHNMLPLLDEYTGELGAKAGPAAFNAYMDRVGATSPNSNVLQNFRTASYYDNLLREGRPLPEIKYKASTGNPYIPEGVIPYPYGNTAQGLHVMNLNALAEGGYPLSRPKPPSFAENMKGNYTPVAIDRHNLTLWGIDRESPNLTGYRYLEDLQQQQAAKMGIAPAQYQAAGWLPYADSGAEPALKLFENRIRTTAEQAGLTKEQVLREFIRGKMRLQ